MKIFVKAVSVTVACLSLTAASGSRDVRPKTAVLSGDSVENNRQTAKRIISDICIIDGGITSCNRMLENGRWDDVHGTTVPLTRADSQDVMNRKNLLIIRMNSKIDTLKSCYGKGM